MTLARTGGAKWAAACAVLMAASIARMWLMPLRSSLWADEMVTAFIVTHGAHHPTLAVAPQLKSVYYVAPRLSTWLLGHSEVAYRLPSVLALGLALYLVARLAARLIHPDAGWFAAFACLSLKGFEYEAADARPYALGTAVACAALWFLVRWLDTGRARHAALFGALAALLWWVHLLYPPFYLVFAIYTALRIARHEAKVTWRGAAAVYAGIAVLTIPVVLDALALRAGAAAHVMTAVPRARDLLDSLKLGLAGVPLAVAIATRGRRLPFSGAVLILAWWLAMPLALFAFSRVTGTSIFLERYLTLALPGAAMVATAGVACLLPDRYWRPAALLLGVEVLFFLGHWNVVWPAHHGIAWRSAAAAINREVPAGTPVLCPSPFIEARPPVWYPGYPADSFLYANLAAYPLRAATVPLPFDVEPDFGEQALPAGPFVLYGGGGFAVNWRDWFLARPQLRGWNARQLGNFGDVVAMVFTPPGATMNFGR